jgi:hypothetical protein
MTPDIISLHTMVMSLPACDAMWRRTGYTASHSHFGIGGNGECWQWQDTAYRAAANYNGNHHIISVETADRGVPFPDWNINDGSAVPAWTPAQCETLAQLIAAMCKAHNIPCEIIPDSKPGRRGIGWHRLGVPGYMVAGGEQWSTAQGKVCPGSRRIAQIPGIVARARQILNPPTVQEDDVAYNSWPKADKDKLTADVAWAILNSEIEDQDKSRAAGKFVGIKVRDAIAHTLRLANKAALEDEATTVTVTEKPA